MTTLQLLDSCSSIFLQLVLLQTVSKACLAPAYLYSLSRSSIFLRLLLLQHISTASLATAYFHGFVHLSPAAWLPRLGFRHARHSFCSGIGVSTYAARTRIEPLISAAAPLPLRCFAAGARLFKHHWFIARHRTDLLRASPLVYRAASHAAPAGGSR